MSDANAATPNAHRNGWPAARSAGNWLKNEVEAIASRRGGAPPSLRWGDTGLGSGGDDEPLNAAPGSEAQVPKPVGAPGGSYAGLALSGGGIRSASICLGVLQALDREGLLRKFGWLSTVSGGGYTGLGWLAHAVRDSALEPGSCPFRMPEAADSPMRRLRDHASYLMAPGFVPALQAAGMLLRKLLANMVLVAPLVLVLAGLIALLHAGWTFGAERFPRLLMQLAWAVLALLLVGAALALRREGHAGQNAWRERRSLDAKSGYILLGLAAVGAALMLALAPEWIIELHHWLRGSWASVLDTGLPSGLAGLVTTIAGLLGAGTIASRLRGRFATLALSVIGVLFLFTLLALAVRILLNLQRKFPGLTVEMGIGLALAMGGAALLLGVAKFTDANALSLHGYYRDHLKSAFFPSGEPPPLSELTPARTGGPLPVVNATVAGASGPGMARRGRPAGPFSLTPLEFGSSALHYASTRQLERLQPDIDAATVMAVSAAAVAPRAGRVTGGRVAIFFKALLNARTGRWLPAPLCVLQSAPPPRADGRYALKEMFGGFLRLPTDRLVLVSDGGHWENLGVLSLVHRYCPLILAIDAEADPAMGFNGLGIATMLSRLDAGSELRVETQGLQRQADGRSQAHFRIGNIQYPDQRTGTLIYVKATLTGDEPPDVQTYCAAHPTFPHETTLDQFFTEAQFEAYRALGEHMGKEVVPALRQALRAHGGCGTCVPAEDAEMA